MFSYERNKGEFDRLSRLIREVSPRQDLKAVRPTHCLRFVQKALYQTKRQMPTSRHRGSGGVKRDKCRGDDDGEARRELHELDEKRQCPFLRVAQGFVS